MLGEKICSSSSSSVSVHFCISANNMVLLVFLLEIHLLELSEHLLLYNNQYKVVLSSVRHYGVVVLRVLCCVAQCIS